MTTQGKNTLTPLMLAAAAGNIEHVLELLESGADVNERGPRASTALMFAVSGGHLEVVRVLVRNGADVEACEEGGWTALRHAHEDGETEIIDFLESRLDEQQLESVWNTKVKEWNPHSSSSKQGFGRLRDSRPRNKDFQ